MKKNVSIIVFAHNNIDYTINTVESLLKNTQNCSKFNYTFNLYDDCSTDNTENYFKSNFKNITYVKQNKNKGFNYLCNLAYSNNKSSDFLVLLNNDLKFSDNWLNILLNEITKNNAKVGGPITNSPGHQKRQNIRNFIDNYEIDDDDIAMNNISKELQNKKTFKAAYINGFCMVFDTIWLKTLSEPIFKYQDPNFGLEDNFFKITKCEPIIVPSSYVFHYKQVTVNRDNWAEHHYRLLKSDKKYKIAIVIITNKRYDSLNKCITSILKQTTDQQFDLFIIDCDINKSANKIMNIKFPKHIQIYYSYEKNKNKSFIKNKIMNQIKYNYDYFTFIKDNQTVNDIWLDSLLSSSIKYNSDIMSGPVKFFTNSKTNENSFSSTRKNKTGDIIKKNDVRNIIIKGKIFNEIEKPFNENFKNIDDSYLHLLNIFSSKGYKIKWCDEAIIYEKLDKKKETLNWTLINHFRIEKAKFYSLKLLKNKMKLILFIFKNIIKIIFLILFFIIGIFFYFTPFKKYFLKKIKKLIECLGFLTAIFNFNR